jgi:hypothetical protein
VGGCTHLLGKGGRPTAVPAAVCSLRRTRPLNCFPWERHMSHAQQAAMFRPSPCFESYAAADRVMPVALYRGNEAIASIRFLRVTLV